MGGEFIFGTIVIVSNMKILISSYLYNGWLFFFVLGSTIFYMLCYSLISYGFSGSQEFGTLQMILEAPQAYFSLFMFTFMFVLVDTGLQYLNIYINKWYLASKEKIIREQAKKAKASKSVIRRKVTAYNSKS